MRLFCDYSANKCHLGSFGVFLRHLFLNIRYGVEACQMLKVRIGLYSFLFYHAQDLRSRSLV